MKKTLILTLLCFFALGFSQKKKSTKTAKKVVEKETVMVFTENDAETTTEPRVIAGFLKQNPGHPKTEDYKRRLVQLLIAGNSATAKPEIKPIDGNKTIVAAVKKNELNNSRIEEAKAEAVRLAMAKNSKSYPASSSKASTGAGPTDRQKRTADMLTHLFNNDISNKEALINIKNRSKCNLIVKINGKKYYNLDVPAGGQNFILVDKGEYALTTMVCDAKYTSIKKINKDIEIVLSID